MPGGTGGCSSSADRPRAKLYCRAAARFDSSAPAVRRGFIRPPGAPAGGGGVAVTAARAARLRAALKTCGKCAQPSGESWSCASTADGMRRGRRLGLLCGPTVDQNTSRTAIRRLLPAQGDVRRGCDALSGAGSASSNLAGGTTQRPGRTSSDLAFRIPGILAVPPPCDAVRHLAVRWLGRTGPCEASGVVPPRRPGASSRVADHGREVVPHHPGNPIPDWRGSVWRKVYWQYNVLGAQQLARLVRVTGAQAGPAGDRVEFGAEARRAGDRRALPRRAAGAAGHPGRRHQG